MRWFLMITVLMSMFSVGALGKGPGKKMEKEPACSPYIFIHLNCYPQSGYFSLGLSWGGYCKGPPEIRHGIQVKSWVWETYIEAGTKWSHPHSKYIKFDLSCMYMQVMVDASIECACGKGDSATETKSYSEKLPMLMPPLWLSRFPVRLL